MAVETIEQHYFTVAQDRKSDLLDHLLERESPEQTIIFCRTKRGTDRLYRQLSHRHTDCGSMHGDMGVEKGIEYYRDFATVSSRYWWRRTLLAGELTSAPSLTSSITMFLRTAMIMSIA